MVSKFLYLLKIYAYKTNIKVNLSEDSTTRSLSRGTHMQKHMSDMPPHAKSESKRNKCVTARGANTLEMGGLGGEGGAFFIPKITLDCVILSAF